MGVPGYRSPIAAFVAVAAFAVAGPAGASSLGVPGLPPGWSHAEINVTIRHQPHTLIYDRGRVTAVTATSLTLREHDGSVVTVDVSPASRVTVAGRPGSLAEVRRLEIATTLRVDGGAATKVTVRIPPGLAAALARQGRGGGR